MRSCLKGPGKTRGPSIDKMARLGPPLPEAFFPIREISSGHLGPRFQRQACSLNLNLHAGRHAKRLTPKRPVKPHVSRVSLLLLLLLSH